LQKIDSLSDACRDEMRWRWRRTSQRCEASASHGAPDEDGGSIAFEAGGPKLAGGEKLSAGRHTQDAHGHVVCAKELLVVGVVDVLDRDEVSHPASSEVRNGEGKVNEKVRRRESSPLGDRVFVQRQAAQVGRRFCPKANDVFQLQGIFLIVSCAIGFVDELILDVRGVVVDDFLLLLWRRWLIVLSARGLTH
jgi:hypothetical protein